MITMPVCEANICHHCNNRCVACNHGSPFAEPYIMSELALKRDLENIKKIYHVGFFCLQGGEPLIHPGILDMMDIAANSGIADNYGILTNGKAFQKMPEGFWVKCSELRFELRCSVYANLSTECQRYANAKAVQYGINYRPGGIGAFFKILGDFPKGESFHGCPWAQCHTIHEGHFYICPISTFWPKQFMGLDPTIDGLKIDDSTREEDLHAFIHRKTPLQSCKRCTGGRAPRVGWHECGTLEEWIRESTI